MNDPRARARYHARRCAEYATGRRIQPLTRKQARWALDFSMLPEQFDMPVGTPRSAQLERGRQTRGALIEHLCDVDDADAYELSDAVGISYARTRDLLNQLRDAGVVEVAQHGKPGAYSQRFTLTGNYADAWDDFEDSLRDQVRPSEALHQFRRKQKAHG